MVHWNIAAILHCQVSLHVHTKIPNTSFSGPRCNTLHATAHVPIIFIDCGNPRKFFREDLCDALTAKVFCLETFMVYGRPRECPAYGQKCSYCHKLQECVNTNNLYKGLGGNKLLTHNRNLGPITKYTKVEQSDTSSNASAAASPDLFIEPIQVEGVKKSLAWFVDVSTSGGKLTFKVLKLVYYPCRYKTNYRQSKPLLKSTNMKLTACGGSSIKPNGTCRLTCSSQAKDGTCEVKFYVAPVNAQPILGLGGCVQFSLVKRVYSMQEEGLTKDMLKQKYPMVFKGLECITLLCKTTAHL